VPDGEVGELLVDAPSAGRATGSAQQEPQTFEGHWTRTGTNTSATPMAAIRSAAVPTTCSRSPASGSPFEVESALDHPPGAGSRLVHKPIRKAVEAESFVVLRADANTDGLHEALKAHVKQKVGPGNIRAGSRW